jgi:HAE1 family hydrophobic/amphiphilic exporter-1
MNLTDIAIKRPLFITVIFTVLFLFGAQSYFKLNYNLLPDITVNTVSISTLYPGASAAEVETSVTRKLEDAFASIEGLDQISSTSQQGVSQISVFLKSGADVDKAERDLQRKADQAMNDLPDDVEKPQVNKIDPDATPVIRAGVTSRVDQRALYDLIDKQVLPLLQNVTGVGKVNIIGGNEREIQVNIDPRRLMSYGLGIGQVTQAVANANQSFPAGSIETKDQQFSIHYDANVTSVDQIKKVIVTRSADGGTVYLENVAEVLDGTAKPTDINHINGLPSVGIEIIKQSDANAVDVSRLVKKRFTDVERIYAGKGLHFTVSSDQSTYTLSSADGVMEDLGMAILIVGVVMLAFLHSFRSSMFVLVALPSSLVPTFIAMYLMGFSLNLMTLMAMSLVVGILVDDSIVVLENIYRHLEMGVDRRKAALDGRNEIGFTALAITLVDVVVFLPLALAGGLIGSILREFSLVVVFSTLMSLFEGMIDRLKEMYGRWLAVILHRKRWLLGGVLVLMAGSFLLPGKGFIGSAFIPAGDRGELLVKLELAPSASLSETNRVAQSAEKIILSHGEVRQVFSSIGFVTGSVVGSSNNNNMAELTVSLTDKKERKLSAEEFGLEVQREISRSVPGVKVSSAPTAITGGGNSAPIQIAINGVNIPEAGGKSAGCSIR